MTVCNMSIEAGAKAGLVAPDDTTFAYLEGRPHAPNGRGVGRRRRLLADARRPTTTPPSTRRSPSTRTRSAPTCRGARTRARCHLDRRPRARPRRPSPIRRPRAAAERALDYMGLDRRHADPRHRRRHRLHRLVHQQPHRGPAARRPRRSPAATSRPACARSSCPARRRSRPQAEAEGLDVVLRDAGFDWREPGCSMCLGMNPDKLVAGRAVRVDVEPQLRGPPGPGRPHPPRLARRRRRHRHRRSLHDARRAVARSDAMEPVRIVQGTAVPLDRSDVDTDQIIPSDWLKRVERTGFEKGLFGELARRPDFVLNRPEHAGASILVAGPNFGTGSSREHAVWALQQYGFGRSCRPASATSSPQLPPRTGSSPARSHAELGARLLRGDRGRPDPRARRRRRSARARGRRPSASSSRSPSTTPSGSASSRASTTSASPSATTPTSPTFEADRPEWLPSSLSPDRLPFESAVAESHIEAERRSSQQFGVESGRRSGRPSS